MSLETAILQSRKYYMLLVKRYNDDGIDILQDLIESMQYSMEGMDEIICG